MVLRPRWHKVLADLWANRVRTILVVISVAVGVLAVGSISTSFVVVGRDMAASWQAINPAGGWIFTSNFDADMLASLGRVPGVGQVEGRSRYSGFKIRSGAGTDRDLTLVGSDDLAALRLDRLSLSAGAWPGRREIALEQSGLGILPVKIGDSVTVSLPDGKARELRVSGFIADRATDTGSVVVQAYTGLDVLESLGLPRAFNWLFFTAGENAGDKAHVAAVGRAIENQFVRSGGFVAVTVIRNPGEHPAAQQSASVMGLLAAMGVLTVILSGLLVVNTVSGLMAQQVRYIGVMKAVGAGRGQILGMYVVMLLCFGLMALVIAAPVGLWLGYASTKMIANALNFGVSALRAEAVPLALMAGLSLGVPLLAGLVPVLGGARMTIRAALSGYGLNAAFGRSLIDRVFNHIRGLSRPLLISLRNTVRRKGRLALTLATLVLAGAIFMGVMSVRASMSVTVRQLFHYFVADVNVDFDRSRRVEDIAAIARTAPGVTAVEGWIFAIGEVQAGGSGAGRNQAATDRLTIMAPPGDSHLVERKVLAGRWLLPDDQQGIVMSTTAMAAHPEWKIGSQVTLKLNAKARETFTIVGTFPFASGEGNKIAMASYDYLAELLNQRGQASSFRLVTEPHDAATQDRARDALAGQFKALGYTAAVASGHTNEDSLGTILNSIVVFLLVMAFLIAVVGGLGLMGTMSMNVLERTREIGVMRSIGASTPAIMRLVLVEGVLIGLLSWAGGALLGLPIAQLLSSIMGQALFGTPFTFIFAWDGLLSWLLIVI
ncbi:MAG TPA: ABC transporter permease, partial [Anaerolineae bacterium]